MAPFTIEGCLVDLYLHTATDNFSPNNYIGFVNPSGLAVYKGLNARDNDSGEYN